MVIIKESAINNNAKAQAWLKKNNYSTGVRTCANCSNRHYGGGYPSCDLAAEELKSNSLQDRIVKIDINGVCDRWTNK